MHISELDTPAIVIDLDIMERNLRRAADYAAQHGLRLRPHTKTHKIPALARRQLQLGAAGITVAKVGEAEVMLAAEPRDLLVAYPVIGARKLARLMEVARRASVTVALDSLEVARPLSEAAAAAGVRIGVLAEADVGLRRVGVAPGEELLALVCGIQSLPALELRGVAFYPGHIKALDAGGMAAIAELSSTIESIRASLGRAGIQSPIISGGSTPTLWQSHLVAGMNEIRPGTYIFNDRNTWLCGGCQQADCAAHVLVTVVSTTVPGQMIIDGGSKTFSSDRCVTGEAGFGYFPDCPEAVLAKMNEEHGFVELKPARERFRPGDRVRVMPNHICVAMNLHETVYGVRGETVEQTWRVEARGKLQ